MIKGEGIKIKASLVKQKKSRGRPKTRVEVLPYENINDLVNHLAKEITAKEAGHTGVDNYIISILDELIKIDHVHKNRYI